MNRDDILRMAREALGAPYSSYLEKRRWDISDKQLERFAALVAAAEREACAKVCEEKSMVKGGEVFAAKIRARSNHAD